MKKSDNPRNTSRRSFVKKSVVASVAAGNLTMFSGLVNAQDRGPSEPDGPKKRQCKPIRDFVIDEQTGEVEGNICYWENPHWRQLSDNPLIIN